jgi:hypothetical protein
MPDIQVTGLTPQQQSDIEAAFIATQGPIPLDDQDPPQPTMTPGKFVKSRLYKFIKDVVRGWKRKQGEATIDTNQKTVDTDFGDLT